MLENVLKVLDAELKQKDFTIEYLRDEICKLNKQVFDLEQQLEELKNKNNNDVMKEIE